MERKGVVIPFVLAAGAAVFYLAVLGGRERALSDQYEKTRVLVARVDIPERTPLKESYVEVVEIPRRWIAQDAFEARTQNDLKMILNLVTRVRIPRGNQISQSALSALSPEAGLSVKVPLGYRAATLGIDPEMRSLVKPGDRVDVLVTFDAVIGSSRQKVTATILQNILVIAVGRNLGQGMTASQFKGQADAEEKSGAAFNEKASISLALNPEELQYLALAREQGATTIGVRGLGDNNMHPIQIVHLGKLMN